MNSPGTTPKFHPPAEAAALLGLSVRTLRRAVGAGELECVRYNSRVWRFRATDLAAWYEKRGGTLSTTRTTRTTPPDA
jgi:excisionase family DNA binding protein